MGGTEREEVVNFFTKNYQRNLEKGAQELATKNLGIDDHGIES